MRTVWITTLAAALLALSLGGAAAQMVVNRNAGEQVDYPYYFNGYHMVRYHGRYAARFHVVPTPPTLAQKLVELTICCQ